MSPDAVRRDPVFGSFRPGAGFGCWGFFIMESEREMIMGIQSVTPAGDTASPSSRRIDDGSRRSINAGPSASSATPTRAKTTRTERLLLFRRGDPAAGAVKARRAGHTTERLDGHGKGAGHLRHDVGHEVSLRAYEINLLDLPPATRTSPEDTYRVLTAVDSALMVIDSGKGGTPDQKTYGSLPLRNTPL